MVKSGPESAEFGPALTNLGQSWPGLFGPESIKFGQNWPGIGPIWQDRSNMTRIEFDQIGATRGGEMMSTLERSMNYFADFIETPSWPGGDARMGMPENPTDPSSTGVV